MLFVREELLLKIEAILFFSVKLTRIIYWFELKWNFAHSGRTFTW